MPYKIKVPISEVREKSYISPLNGRTECVAFVQQVTNVGNTTSWVAGKKVMDAKPSEIVKGTAVATFDSKGRYPTDGKGKHAAIYLYHNESYVKVLDQWAAKGKVTERPIYYNKPTNTRRSNDGRTFYVIERKI